MAAFINCAPKVKSKEKKRNEKKTNFHNFLWPNSMYDFRQKTTLSRQHTYDEATTDASLPIR